ncbi:MAG TPA: crotonase/enoyl-CoA hydratase family protein, partial [Thermodesulfobacteriota bacterium]|nr:crotonase/enoyl-CoA hydratase family protein [Thermodesulfobacteriota bacterium]
VNHSYKNMVARFDIAQGIMWTHFDTRPRPCVTKDLLHEYLDCQRLVTQVDRTALESGNECPVRFLVLASKTQGIYSLGGDLQLFKQCIETRDRETLRQYASACIEALHLMANNLFLPLTTISLVQGDALGGGCEAALSCSVIIAERKARFGFPEVMFNLFPGMGAYSFLARRIGMVKTERIILSGSVFTAEEFHEMGIVDVLVADGGGEGAVHTYVEKHKRRPNAYESVYRARQRYHAVTSEELTDIADMWVDTAMRVRTKDLRIMEMLVRSQDRLRSGGPAQVRPIGEGTLVSSDRWLKNA